MQVWLHSFLTSVLVGDSCYIRDLAALLPLNRRLVGPWSQSGRFGEAINAISLLVMGPQFLSCPVHQLVSVYYNILAFFFIRLTQKCLLISSLFLTVFPDSKSPQVTHFSGPDITLLQHTPDYETVCACPSWRIFEQQNECHQLLYLRSLPNELYKTQCQLVLASPARLLLPI